MSVDWLPCVEVKPPGPAKGSVIWLHGLGADGHDFEPIVPYLGLGTTSRCVSSSPTRPSAP